MPKQNKQTAQNKDIVIYQTPNKDIKIDIRLDKETLWLKQEQIASLFGVKRPSITKHLNNIFKSKELEEMSVCSILELTASDGKKYKTKLYNLDAVLSVGYRVNSNMATQFRIWATKILKDYLTKGYALNSDLLAKRTAQLNALKTAVSIIKRGFNGHIESLKDASDINALLNDFAQGLNLLDDYDRQQLDKQGKTKKKTVKITEKEFLQVIGKMRASFNSDVFAMPKDKSFASSVNQIYQTFNKTELYPTIEEKAAALLYLIVKNHSFVDGNKRIGASCFLYFLDRNGILYSKDGKAVIDGNTAFALTLLAAISNPKEKDVIISIILSVLNR